MGLTTLRNSVFLVTHLLVLPMVSSFSLFGEVPHDYNMGDILEVKVSKLSSIRTQLPYDYYSLSYCRPPKLVNGTKNWVEFLQGDRTLNSVYTFKLGKEESCKVACRVKLNAESAQSFKEKIIDGYRINMIMDGLPVAERFYGGRSNSKAYMQGYDVGFDGIYYGEHEYKYFINNHLSFNVMYHPNLENGSAQIVGFEVTAQSIEHAYKEWDDENTRLMTCNPSSKDSLFYPFRQEVNTTKEVVFSYDVTFESSDIRWKSRWDAYFLWRDDLLERDSITDSIATILLILIVLAGILRRTLYRDVSYYNQMESNDEIHEISGWKTVHGDVFRPPSNPTLICIYVGTGLQLFGTTLVTMTVAGLILPSNGSGVLTVIVLSWILMGLVSGYFSARLYDMFGGTDYKTIALRTATLFPAILFMLLIVLVALIWTEKSYSTLSLLTLSAVVFLWLGISVPLNFVGSYFAFKMPGIKDPVKTLKIPREIPKQPWYRKPVFCILVGGFMISGLVVKDFSSILTSIRYQQHYGNGFLFLHIFLSLVQYAEITILLCFIHLHCEDYNWWWRAYTMASSSAFFLFIDSVYWFYYELNITKPVSGFVYVGFALIASFVYFFLMGTVGFCACFWFVRKIYSSLKME